MTFKRTEWLARKTEYRISQGHDAAAALVLDGRVVAAAAEERFNTRKHSARPHQRDGQKAVVTLGAMIDQVDRWFDVAPMTTLPI